MPASFNREPTATARGQVPQMPTLAVEAAVLFAFIDKSPLAVAGGSRLNDQGPPLMRHDSITATRRGARRVHCTPRYALPCARAVEMNRTASEHGSMNRMTRHVAILSTLFLVAG